MRQKADNGNRSVALQVASVPKICKHNLMHLDSLKPWLLFCGTIFLFFSNRYSHGISVRDLAPFCNNDKNFVLVEQFEDILSVQKCPGTLVLMDQLKPGTKIVPANSIEGEIKNFVKEYESEYAKKTSNLQVEPCGPNCDGKLTYTLAFDISPANVNDQVKCPKEFIKRHVFKKKFNASGKDCLEKSSNDASQWIESTIVGPFHPLVSPTSEGRELAKQCPDDCSYYTQQYFEQEDCQTKLTLIVDCNNLKKNGSKYNVSGFFLKKWVCSEK